MCVRPEAPSHGCHASDKAFSSRVPPAAVRALVATHVARDRVPSSAASIRSSSWHRGGYFGSAGRLGGEEARRFDSRHAVCSPRLAPRRRFAVCLEDAQRHVQRRCAAFPGQWEAHLYACDTLSRSHDVWGSCARMVSDAGTHLVGPLVIGRYVTDVTIYTQPTTELPRTQTTHFRDVYGHESKKNWGEKQKIWGQGRELLTPLLTESAIFPAA